MKTCPICKTKSFEDISTCFNCMHSFEDALGAGTSTEEIAEQQEQTPALFKLYPQAGTFEPAGELPIRVGIRAAKEDAQTSGNEARLEIVLSLQPSLTEVQDGLFNSSFAGADNVGESQRQVIELC